MTPVGDPTEAESELSQKVHHHSPGMISFTTQLSDLEAVEKTIQTEEFRKFVAPILGSALLNGDGQ